MKTTAFVMTMLLTMLLTVPLSGVAALTGDKGARELIRQNEDRTARIQLPEAAFDIDTPEDIWKNT